jgi:hypothetical protein
MAENAKSASEKFELFRAEYLAHGNAYRAALAAGYSERMAKSKSWKLAKRAKATQPEAVPTAAHVDECPKPETAQQEAPMLRNAKDGEPIFLPRRWRVKPWIYRGPRRLN